MNLIPLNVNKAEQVKKRGESCKTSQNLQCCSAITSRYGGIIFSFPLLQNSNKRLFIFFLIRILKNYNYKFSNSSVFCNNIIYTSGLFLYFFILCHQNSSSFLQTFSPSFCLLSLIILQNVLRSCDDLN